MTVVTSQKHRAQADDDGLVGLDAHTAQRVNGSTNGKRVDRGAQAAASSAQKDSGGADERVKARSHHGRGKQRVKRYGLLAHAIGGATQREDEHENRNDPDLFALEFLNKHGNAVVEGARLGHHPQETTEDHNEETNRQGVGEALHRSGKEVAERCGRDVRRKPGDDRGDDATMPSRIRRMVKEDSIPRFFFSAAAMFSSSFLVGGLCTSLPAVPCSQDRGCIKRAVGCAVGP